MKKYHRIDRETYPFRKGDSDLPFASIDFHQLALRRLEKEWNCQSPPEWLIVLEKSLLIAIYQLKRNAAKMD